MMGNKIICLVYQHQNKTTKQFFFFSIAIAPNLCKSPFCVRLQTIKCTHPKMHLAKQMIHMKCQALFSLKINFKKIKMLSAAIVNSTSTHFSLESPKW